MDAETRHITGPKLKAGSMEMKSEAQREGYGRAQPSCGLRMTGMQMKCRPQMEKTDKC